MFHRDQRTSSGVRSRCKACRKVEGRLYYVANRERIADYTASRRDRQRELEAGYRNSPRGQALRKRRAHRRRARKAFSVPQRWRRSECPDDRCYWCGCDLTDMVVHVDHIMPISLGGPAEPNNEANTCVPCNQAKHGMHPLVWIAQQFR